MKIAHVISGVAKASGPTTFCIRIVDQLAERGASVGLYVEEVEDDPLLPQDPAVEVVEFGNRFCPAARPDILHAHALWIASSHRAITYAMRTKTPCVFSAHGMLAPWAMRHKWLKKKIAWWLYQKRDLGRVALFHVTAECEVTWLRDLGFKQPCVLVPLGSDLPEVSPAKAQRHSDVRTVLFVGRIYPVKGLMNLVRAWAEVRSALARETENGGQKTEKSNRLTNERRNSSTKACPHWQLVIAGPDQAGHKAELMAEAKRLGVVVAEQAPNEPTNSGKTVLLPDLVFTGPVYGEEKDVLYRMADLFVLPSFTENFGVVVTDALSYAVPVITTKGTPWSELLGDSDSSFIHCCGHAAVGESEDGRSAVVRNCERPLVDNTEDRRLMKEIGSGSTHDPANTRTHGLARSGRAGWWIDIGVDPLVEALREAMGMTDEERRQMGLNGRQLVENKYTWPAIAEQMESAYDWLLGKGEKPECVIQ